jgi:tungstate transport system ATP-binding protein
VIFSTTIAANIGYGLKARGMPHAEIEMIVEEAMDWAGVSHLRNYKPQTLSGGEKQRIALARAKVLKPELLLLDEPTSSLDDSTKERVVTLIPDLIRDGSSIVMASHDDELIGQAVLTRLSLSDGRLHIR